MEYNPDIVRERIKTLIAENKQKHITGYVDKDSSEYHLYQKRTLANVIGVEERTLYNYINGIVEVPLRHIVKIAEVFSCEVGYIVGEFDCKTKEVSQIHEATGLSEKAVKILKRAKENPPYFDTDNLIINKVIEGIDTGNPFGAIAIYLDAKRRIADYRQNEYFERITNIVHSSTDYKPLHNYGIYDIQSLSDNLAIYRDTIEAALKEEGYTQGQINYIREHTNGYFMDYFESEITDKYILGDIATSLITYLKTFDFEEDKKGDGHGEKR